MLNEQQTYELYLEDYSYPRYAAVARPYYGTRIDFAKLRASLLDDGWTSVRYSELINCIECYDLDWDMTHSVSGVEYPLLTPVTELCRYEFQLENKYWSYTTYRGVTYRLYAGSVDVSRLLISLNDGNISLCIKACFGDLMVYSSENGWTYPGANVKGFPGTVRFDGSKHIMCLYVLEECYQEFELDMAMEDIKNINNIDFGAACQDILGEV